MPQDPVIVVGDRFEEFLTNRGTIPASTLIKELESGTVEPGTVIIVGQGLSLAQRDALESLVEQKAPEIRFAGGVMPRPAGRDLTHKHHLKNAMITPPTRVDDTRFVAELVIDEHNEILEDHLTGQHIPGVALTEAARQTWTAVTEKFLLDDPQTRTRFVLGWIRSTYHRFVFPLPATVEYTLLRRESAKVQETLECLVSIRQNDTVAAEIEAQYLVIPEKFSAKQEAMAARATVTALLSQQATDPALVH